MTSMIYEFGRIGTIASPCGELRQVLIPAEIPPEKLPEILLKGCKGLCKREYEVAKMLARGLTRKAMADEFGYSDDAIASALNTLYAKLGVENEKQACVVLGRYGLSWE